MYNTNSPILFLIFNRPSTTQLVFESIKSVKPTKLYIAADGPRFGNNEDEENCNKVKEIVSNIDWNCEVKTLFRNKNLGCKYAVSSSIDWFFENEIQGIILEDDCLPSQDFFRFCDTMLQHYSNDNRIRFISGSNFQKEKSTINSYYFSNLSHVWGWASWRRAWKDYDVELKNFRENDNYKSFLSIFNNDYLAKDWNEIMEKLFKNEIDTWDYQLAITNMFNNGLSIMPNANLISNIGYGTDATHTFKSNGFENLKFDKLDEIIIHPKVFLANKKADFETLSIEHNIFERTKIPKKKNKFYKFWKKS